MKVFGCIGNKPDKPKINHVILFIHSNNLPNNSKTGTDTLTLRSPIQYLILPIFIDTNFSFLLFGIGSNTPSYNCVLLTIAST